MNKSPNNNKPKAYRVKASRTINAYVYLLSAAAHALENAKTIPAGSFFSALQAAVCAAFALEAYANHLGARVMPLWDQMDRLPPMAKLEILHHELLKQRIDWSKAPFQAVKELIDLRNDLAHGRTETVSYDALVLLRDDERHPEPRVDWEERCYDVAAAPRYLDATETVIRLLHKNYRPNQNPLFELSVHESGKQLVTDPVEQRKAKRGRPRMTVTSEANPRRSR